MNASDDLVDVHAEQRLAECKRWLEMAWTDCVAAMSGSVAYSICFHTQQWIEKTAKALLALHGLKIPPSHDVRMLLERCEEVEPSLIHLSEKADLFKPFAVDIRYDHDKSLADQNCRDLWLAATEIAAAVRACIDGNSIR